MSAERQVATRAVGFDNRARRWWREVGLLGGLLFVSAAAQASGPVATIETGNGDKVIVTGDGPIQCVYDGRLNCTRHESATDGIASGTPGACPQVVEGNLVVTNTFTTTQQFIVSITLPVAPIGPATVMGGSVSGTVTDANSDGVGGMGTATSVALYTALIDGAAVATLHDDPFFAPGPGLPGTFASPGSSPAIPAASFGLPGLTTPGPAVMSSIGIQIIFNLAASDSASLSSDFTVDCVPTPTPSPTITATPTSTATATVTSTVTPTDTPTHTPVPGGGSCTDTSECARGFFCVDSVCCSSPCDGPLLRCDVPPNVGTCTSTVATAPTLSPTGLLVGLIVLLAIAALALWRTAAPRAGMPGRD